MRGSARNAQGQLRIADYTIDPIRNIISGPNGEVHLEPKVIELAVELTTHRGEVISRDALIDRIWGGAFGADQCLASTVSRLRRALRDENGTDQLIETIPKRGYRLMEARSAPEKPIEQSSPTGIFYALLVTTLLIIAGATISIIEQSSVHETRIAVLPIRSLSDDTSDLQFAEGLSEEISNTLAQRLPIHVMGHISSVQYIKDNRPLTDIADDINLDFILEGSVRHIDGQIRVTIRLLDAHSGFDIWSEIFDKALNDRLIAQQDIATHLADQLEVQLEQLDPKTLTSNKRAMKAYLSGLAHYRRFGLNMRSRRGIEHLLKAQEEFNIALDYDAKFASAHARLGIVYTLIARTPNQNTYKNRAFIMSDARHHVERALKLAPKMSEAHLAHGYLLLTEAKPAFSQKRLYRSINEALTKAVQYNPNNYEAFLLLAYFDVEFGLGEAAVDYLTRAQAIEPDGRDILLQKARLFMWQGNFHESERSIKRLLELYPDFIEAQVLYGRFLRSQNRLAEALSFYKKAMAKRDNPVLHHAYGLFLMDLGLKEEAIPHLKAFYQDNWPPRAALFERDYQPYQAALNELAAAHPDNIDIKYDALRFAWKAGHNEDFIRLFHEVYPKPPDNLDSIDVHCANIGSVLMAATYFELNQQQEHAKAILEEVRDYLDKQFIFNSWVSDIVYAEIFAGLGDNRQALHYLRQSMFQGPFIQFHPKWWSVGVHWEDDISFQSLRSDPEYQAFLDERDALIEHVLTEANATKPIKAHQPESGHRL